MRILDTNSNKKIKNINLYLTLPEAKELYSSLKGILEKSEDIHAHIADENFEREITICIYDKSNLDNLDQDSKRIILEG